MIQDAELIKKNCVEYIRAHNKAVEVLKKADGETHYTEIAKVVGIHNTQVSSLLKKATMLGLATKIRAGVYKKTSGILGYMPRQKKIKDSPIRTVQSIIQKISKKPKIKSTSPFISSLTIPNRIEMNLNKMTNAYRALYAVENTLRELIRKVLGQKPNWWKNYVPSGIQTQVRNTISETPYHAAPRNDELEYTHLGQLKEIITFKNNWTDFLPYLNEKNKSFFIATIDKAIPSRNAIAHSIPLKAKDLKVVDVRFEDILKMVK